MNHVVRYRPIQSHDDVIKWNHFPRNWTFVRGFHRYLVNPWWYETPSRPLWRYCYVPFYPTFMGASILTASHVAMKYSWRASINRYFSMNKKGIIQSQQNKAQQDRIQVLRSILHPILHCTLHLLQSQSMGTVFENRPWNLHIHKKWRYKGFW